MAFLLQGVPVVEHVVLGTPKVAGQRPLHMVQISDLHITKSRDVQRLARAITLIDALEPDVIVLTGDYVSEQAHLIDLAIPLLGELRAPLGVYAVLGNHDLWSDREIVTEGLERAGITVLVNQGTAIDNGSSRVYLAGLDDGWSGSSDLTLALAGYDGEMPVVLLFHEPDLGHDMVADGTVWLQLSGHSHGGQVRIPGRGALVLPDYARRYSHGLYAVGSGWIYVNRGLGTTAIPVRVGSRPEVTSLMLYPPYSDGSGQRQ